VANPDLDGRAIPIEKRKVDLIAVLSFHARIEHGGLKNN